MGKFLTCDEQVGMERLGWRSLPHLVLAAAERGGRKVMGSGSTLSPCPILPSTSASGNQNQSLYFSYMATNYPHQGITDVICSLKKEATSKEENATLLFIQ